MAPNEYGHQLVVKSDPQSAFEQNSLKESKSEFQTPLEKNNNTLNMIKPRITIEELKLLLFSEPNLNSVEFIPNFQSYKSIYEDNS